MCTIMLKYVIILSCNLTSSYNTIYIFKFVGGGDKMSIPNILTIFRLILIPLFIFLFFSNSLYNLEYSTCIFLLAGLTDFLDGYLARKLKLITKIGIVLDPLADKLMLMTVLTCLVIGQYIPVWFLVIIAAKELFMILCGVLLYKKGTVIASNKFGKISTILFYISIFVLVISESAGIFLLYISVASALVALFNYTTSYTKREKAGISHCDTLDQ